jgi:hypothetical protein
VFFHILVPAFLLELHCFPNKRIDNRFMVFFNMELLHMPLVLNPFLVKEIHRVAFLQNGIALILLITKDNGEQRFSTSALKARKHGTLSDLSALVRVGFSAFGV